MQPNFSSIYKKKQKNIYFCNIYFCLNKKNNKNSLQFLKILYCINNKIFCNSRKEKFEILSQITRSTEILRTIE